MREADFAWMTENSLELFSHYAGKWIAVRDGQVIGVGDTAVEADQQARQKAPDGQFVLEAIETESDVIYGHP